MCGTISTELLTDFVDKDMEFKRYEGKVSDLTRLQEYLASVTLLINQLKLKYGVNHGQ